MKPEWQESVRTKLEKDRVTEKEFAARIGCAQSTMHDTLHNPEARHSTLVPAIHAALGWDPPHDPGEAPPLPSADAIELGHMYDRLPESIRKQLRDQARTYVELVKAASGEDN